MEEKLRFGAIIDDIKMRQWQANTIKMLVANGYKLSLLIKINGQGGQTAGKKAAKFVSKAGRRLFFNAQNLHDTKLSDMVDISGIPIKSCIAKTINGTMFLGDNDIQYIENQNIDFILHLSEAPIGGEITNLTKHGVWEFCFHDEEKYNTAIPIGFWEFTSKDDCNVVSLQKINNQINKACIIKKNRYPIIRKSYSEHIDNILSDCYNMALQACRDIEVSGKLLDCHETRVGDESKDGAGVGALLKYWAVKLWRKMVCREKSIDGYDLDICYIDVPLLDFCKDSNRYRRKAKWLRRASTTQRYSTPFVITTAEDCFIFFTVSDSKDGSSNISMIKKSEKFKKQHIVLNNGHTVSYPYVFRLNDGIFCIPQDIDSQQVTLYKFNEDNCQFEIDTVLIDGIKAHNPSIVFGNGVWNIFFGKDGSQDDKLFLYTSSDIRGPYVSFFNNPVKTDNLGSLMAGGFFSINGKTFRPSFNSKRRGITMNEIIKMDDCTYSEKEVSELSVAPLRRCRFGNGIQCISGNDTITVLGGMR